MTGTMCTVVIAILVLKKKGDGGGCIIAIKTCFNSSRTFEWESVNEDLWVSLDLLSGEKLHINVRYVQCVCPRPIFKDHLSSISDTLNVSNPGGRFLLLGDFNLAVSMSIVWTVNSDGICVALDVDSSNADLFVDMLSLTSLNQFSSVRNELDRTLDLVLFNIEPSELTVTQCPDELVPADRHHPPLSIDIDLKPMLFLNEDRLPKRNFFRANYEEMASVLNEMNWVSLFEHLSLDDAVNEFYDVLMRVIESVPKTKCATRSYPC